MHCTAPSTEGLFRVSGHRAWETAEATLAGLSLRGDTPLPRSAIPRGSAPSALTDQEDLPCILREDGELSPTIIVMDYRLEKIDISWIKKERIKVVLFRLRNKYRQAQPSMA